MEARDIRRQPVPNAPPPLQEVLHTDIQHQGSEEHVSLEHYRKEQSYP